jgi:hypothetical protein
MSVKIWALSVNYVRKLFPDIITEFSQFKKCTENIVCFKETL